MLHTEQFLNLVPASIENEDFIFDAFKAALKEYVSCAWGWDDAQQRKGLLASAPIQQFQLIRLGRDPVGALLLQKREHDHYLRTMFLLPPHQRQGIGRLIISALQQEATAAVKPLQLRVIRVNPARRLYERMGFTILQEEEKTLLMQWQEPKGLGTD
jgi:GNAT superfamily N-acetyltransferase